MTDIPSLTPIVDEFEEEYGDYGCCGSHGILLELARELETNLHDTQFVLESVHETNRVLLEGMAKLKAENDRLRNTLEDK